METNKILSSNVLDIIFDGRNKMYGAYNLRTTYNVRLSHALLFTGSFAMVISLCTLFPNSTGEKIPVIDFVDHTMFSAKVEPALRKPQQKLAVKNKVNQQIFTVPVIVIDKLVTKSDVLTGLNEKEAIGSRTIEGGDKGQIEGPVEEVQNKSSEAPESEKAREVSSGIVEIEAEFPGGHAAWAKYLKKNLNGDTPVDNGAPAGIYQVIVQFIVSKDGSISDVHTLTTHGYGMEEEAVKIINRGPKWKPAIQNGRNVNAYRSQPITFVVDQN